MATLFPMRARRGDVENGYMVVQQMVEWLRDIFDTDTAKLSRGSTTVTNGNTSVVVLLGTTYAAGYSVVVTPLADPGARFWVSAKTASQFQINLGVAAPVAGIAFDWVAKAV